MEEHGSVTGMTEGGRFRDIGGRIRKEEVDSEVFVVESGDGEEFWTLGIGPGSRSQNLKRSGDRPVTEDEQRRGASIVYGGRPGGRGRFVDRPTCGSSVRGVQHQQGSQEPLLREDSSGPTLEVVEGRPGDGNNQWESGKRRCEGACNKQSDQDCTQTEQAMLRSGNRYRCRPCWTWRALLHTL